MTLADVKASSQSNPDSPGPGVYSPADTMTKRLSPSFAFGGNLAKVDRATTGALAEALRSSSPVRGRLSMPPTRMLPRLTPGSTGTRSVQGRRQRREPVPVQPAHRQQDDHAPRATLRYSAPLVLAVTPAPLPLLTRGRQSAKPDLPASGAATEGPGFKYTTQVSAFSKQASSTSPTASRSLLTSRPKHDVYVTSSGSLIYRTAAGNNDGEGTLAESEVHRAERASSRRSRSASWGFGSGPRLGKEPSTAAAELGPVYDTKIGGRQSPQYSFGKEQREPEALKAERRKAVPGPGQYRSASGFGGQSISTRPTSSYATLGRSSRDVGSKLYASKADMRGTGDPNTAARGAGTPGPGQYAPNVSPVSSKRSPPRFSFGGKGITRGERSIIVGTAAPGSYRTPGSLGMQGTSRHRSAPRTTFGRASRDKAGRVTQPGVQPAAASGEGPVRRAPRPTPQHSRLAYSLFPSAQGPGDYAGAAAGTLGSQSVSTRRSYLGNRFGRSQRSGGTRGQMPGPGKYTSPSSVGRQASSRTRSSPGFKFGTSQRQSPDQY